MEKQWRVISNADGIDEEFATLAEAVKEAEAVLDLWRQQARDEGEWDEDVEGVEVHLVTHAARITMRDGDNEDDGVEYGITEILDDEISKELLQLRADRDRLLETVKLAYRKHHMDDPAIGWEELDTKLFDAICNVIGDGNFTKWLKTV